jgi:hypothetical protein
MTIPNLTTANTFSEWMNDTQQLIALMNALIDGPQVNANSHLVLSKLSVANLILTGALSGLNTAMVMEAASNLYFTAARVRANVSNTGPVTYDATNGIFGFANSGVTANSYGNGTSVLAMTVDQYGRVTALANTNVLTPVAKNHNLISTRRIVNFVEGANIAITVVDDAANDQANVILSGLWGGGPNPLGFTVFRVRDTTIAANTNTANFFSGAGVNIVGVYDSSGSGEVELYFYANNAYEHANGAFSAANAAQLAVNANTTNANIRSKFSNVAAVTYDQTNGIFGHANSGVTATGYGSATEVPVVVVNAQGHVTGVTNTAITYTGARSVLSNTAPVRYEPSTGVISHADSGVTATGYGSTTQVPVLVVNASGHVTAVTNTAISYTGARSVLSATSPISYNSGTGDFSHATSGVSATGYGSDVLIPVFVVNASGHVTSVTNTTIRSASTGQTGIVQLTDSTSSSSTTTAATPNSVKTVQDALTTHAATHGTMAQQNATNVNITGGTIANTSVSATRVAEEWNQYSPTSGQSFGVDWAKGGSNITNNGVNTISFSNIPSGLAGHMVKVSNLNNTTFPAAVTWGLGGKPSVAGEAIISLITYNGGTTVYASVVWRAV